MSLLSTRSPRARKELTRPVVKTASVPAPIRGLNYRDSLAEMKPTDALVLDDVICRAGYLEVRKGWAPTATGLPATIESLFPYKSLAGGAKLFAASGTAFYDVTASGAVGAAVVTGLTNAYWQHAQVSGVAANYLICVNGVDSARIYDGSTWAALSISGVSAAALSNVTVWKRRVWFVERNSMKAWYLDADAISGAATSFSFSALFKRGGNLVALLNWTIDGGAGPDDYLVAVTSEGEIAVYRGTDPTSAATFELVGVYTVGRPVGLRFHAKLGGDLILLTTEGLIPLSRYLQSQTVDRSTFLSDRIQQLISQDVTSYFSTQGWEVHVFQDDNFLFVQVPAGSLGSRYQYVMSLITGGWSRFRFSSAACWAQLNSTLYHGQSTQVADCSNYSLDNGSPIPYTVMPAFADFAAPTQQKRLSLGRLTIESDIPPVQQITALTNYNRSYVPASLPSGVPTGVLWDSAVWDVAVWGGYTTISSDWYSLSGLGYALSQVVQGLSRGSVTRFIAFDYVFEPGGLL